LVETNWIGEPMTDKRYMLCHFLASIAYHLQKALRNAPTGFPTFRVSPTSRTPQELVKHIDSVLGYARICFLGGKYTNTLLDTMEQQVQQVHQTIESLAALIAEGKPMLEITEEQLLQGPLSDSMTHIGQISYLRRLYGSAVQSEDFIYAKISINNLSINQPLPERPDLDWKA
jgi:hypothetical protein